MKRRANKLEKIRVYLTQAEYAAVADMAAANNLSVGKCFKVAGLQKIRDVYAEVTAKIQQERDDEEDSDTSNDDEHEQLLDSEELVKSGSSGIDDDLSDDVQESST